MIVNIRNKSAKKFILIWLISSSEIEYLHEINSTLKEEYDLQSNYENLSQRFKILKKEEQDQLEKAINLKCFKQFLIQHLIFS